MTNVLFSSDCMCGDLGCVSAFWGGRQLYVCRIESLPPPAPRGGRLLVLLIMCRYVRFAY